MVCVNGADQCVTPPQWLVGYRPGDQRFICTDDGRLEHVELYAPNAKFIAQSKYGMLKRKPDGSATRVVSHISDDEGLRPKFFMASKEGLDLTSFGLDDFGVKARVSIAKVRVTYTRDGLMASEKFLDLFGNSAADKKQDFWEGIHMGR